MLQKIYRLILRRPYFKGQARLFNYLFKRDMLKLETDKLAAPLDGNFQIYCNTKTWIGAQVYYLGEYEEYVKKVFKKHIKPGDTVLDIGANIGFHTLYFSELVGADGKVIAFEPVPSTFNLLQKNIKCNLNTNIASHQLALGDKKETLNIEVDENSTNPGANNLFITGNTTITCVTGDEAIKEQVVNFIKIDVEGFEIFALRGLAKTIANSKPIIVFEFDAAYQHKTGEDQYAIFHFLSKFNYEYFKVENGKMSKILNVNIIGSGDILALPI